ncbi:exodeoxyribonuclease V subunit beta [Massilia arenae]|uniref:RecBCD enzyme subunit RecB n=1 Tax=Massilia arenae TaxID=2603288 RepID=A0A5C7FRE7_9BURK|nr:exodeoxyribonuclease V subunit beta [Massilia arenae]TXF98415.1 exodeoxyribonuclease V subunit beta [Massilia arenae]
MSQDLVPLVFPLHGSRLIEASAGTGKTWTIAALYVRLVLGHGGPDAFSRPLLPAEILVMTFTRAATRELSNRVRERLVQAAGYFRGQEAQDDPYLAQLAADYPDQGARDVAAHRLMLAAETMDEAAIFTIDAWCQRMLREHAFDSGSLFDEELVSSEDMLFEDAANDYWRQHVYPLGAEQLSLVLDSWKDVGTLKKKVRKLVALASLLDADSGALGPMVARLARADADALAGLKEGWSERAALMEAWIADQRANAGRKFNGSMYASNHVAGWFAKLRGWVNDPQARKPDLLKGWERLTPDGIRAAGKDGYLPDVPACFDATEELQRALEALAPVSHAMLAHAAFHIGRRMQELKRRNRQFGFADMLERLKAALEGENGEALRRRIVDQYPVAMVDEFQDTSPDQYRIFDLLYRVEDNDPQRGLFLIGDPKQSIYGFRGADINSYLAARLATTGRHYKLGTNFRSSAALVAAVNRVFAFAEENKVHPGHAAGAFRFRKGELNPLPFEPVKANDHRRRLVGVCEPYQALAMCLNGQEDMKAEAYRTFFAHHCAEHIVGLLNDEQVGFEDEKDGKAVFERLQPADIAILVRSGTEAATVRKALTRRGVKSVYLSDKDSVLHSDEAHDVLRWLRAVAAPLDGALARAAFATRSAGLELALLARLSVDELEWEARIEQLKGLHGIWQRQGVLAMLRRFIHQLGLPARLLNEAGGERSLTNLLHLAELLQEASGQLEGEQALVRWLAEQIEAEDGAGDERVVRLESDDQLVKVVTVHKSKGLEYPLVYLPFGVTMFQTTRKDPFFNYIDADGERRIDFARSDASLEAVDRARLEEELRLLYVALTRARHFLWLGAAGVMHGNEKSNRLHETALGYLLRGGERMAADELSAHVATLRGDVDGIVVHELAPGDGVTLLSRQDAMPDLVRIPAYSADFERDWSVGSFTSMTRHAVAPPTPMRAQEQTLLEEAPQVVTPPRIEDAPWHRFPRGSVPGNFMHEQLEWLAREGFDCLDDADCQARLVRHIERQGWGNRLDDALAWLRAIVDTPLPPLNAALRDLKGVLPEMEFWFPSQHLDLAALDALCRTRLLGGVERPVLPDRVLHGMLKGFADLVFEHEGRYWVLDYKSNALGPGDAAYTRPAMEAGMAEHRYEIQGSIYLLALHRLLRSRLGDAYEPEYQLGGAVFMFLRGIANPDTRGCCVLAPDLDLLDELERLLDKEQYAEG